ncbi:hypothetical protein GLS_c08180 [Gluconobacter oxydans DSM 3504]|uniref:Uncharacterized protein n=1 Tax=Gluconobacter oxydans DSM 3504 TaxID=1288313 RepID=A0A067Z1D5_GLUOY|nr:hypothetical protein GLS_c08180 [Gluconobacter oxydans DSM 3504]
MGCGRAAIGSGIGTTHIRDILHFRGKNVTRNADILIVFGIDAFFLAQRRLRLVHLLERVDAGVARRVRVGLQHPEDLVDGKTLLVDRGIVVIGLGLAIIGPGRDRAGEGDGERKKSQQQGGTGMALDHDSYVRRKSGPDKDPERGCCRLLQTGRSEEFRRLHGLPA